MFLSGRRALSCQAWHWRTRFFSAIEGQHSSYYWKGAPDLSTRRLHSRLVTGSADASSLPSPTLGRAVLKTQKRLFESTLHEGEGTPQAKATWACALPGRMVVCERAACHFLQGSLESCLPTSSLPTFDGQHTPLQKMESLSHPTPRSASTPLDTRTSTAILWTGRWILAEKCRAKWPLPR